MKKKKKQFVINQIDGLFLIVIFLFLFFESIVIPFTLNRNISFDIQCTVANFVIFINFTTTRLNQLYHRITIISYLLIGLMIEMQPIRIISVDPGISPYGIPSIFPKINTVRLVGFCNQILP